MTEVLIDIMVAVEKTTVGDNRTEEERMADNLLQDYIYIDSEEEPEELNYKIKEEIIEALDELDVEIDTGEDLDVEEEETPVTVQETPQVESSVTVVDIPLIVESTALTPTSAPQIARSEEADAPKSL